MLAPIDRILVLELLSDPTKSLRTLNTQSHGFNFSSNQRKGGPRRLDASLCKKDRFPSSREVKFLTLIEMMRFSRPVVWARSVSNFYVQL